MPARRASPYELSEPKPERVRGGKYPLGVETFLARRKRIRVAEKRVRPYWVLALQRFEVSL